MTDTAPTFRFSRIPVWAIAGWLIIQTISLIIWGAKMDERLSSVERDQRAAAQDHVILAVMNERTIKTDKNVEHLVDRLEATEPRR